LAFLCTRNVPCLTDFRMQTAGCCQQQELYKFKEEGSISKTENIISFLIYSYLSASTGLDRAAFHVWMQVVSSTTNSMDKAAIRKTIGERLIL